MSVYSFENELYRDKLTRQVVHMDQGACYAPEYLATRHMHNYPSRVTQIIRAVLLDELDASSYGADIVFRSILSGQGERWQNFGEDPNDYILCMLLGRELFVKKGLSRSIAGQAYDVPEPKGCREAWERALPLQQDGEYCLALDDATFAYVADVAPKLGEFFIRHKMALSGMMRFVSGFAAMAHGCLEEGKAQLACAIEELNGMGKQKVLTVSGATYWALTTLADVLGIAKNFEVVDILDLASAMDTQRAYIYGGSFYTRYLKKGQQLMRLTENTVEKPMLNTPEFEPLYDADKRINAITLFGAPVCPEYMNTHTQTVVLESIREAAFNTMGQASFEQLVVCDPFSYNEIAKSNFASGKLKYFLEVLI